MGAATGGGGIAYWAHLGGFGGGVLLATALTTLKWVEISDAERTLLDIFHVRKRWAGRAEEQARSTLWRKPPPPPVRAPAPPPPPVPIEEAALIRFKCACGKALQVKREYAGKTGRCPACGQAVKIPLALRDE